jgi:hypothetical protein
MNPLPATSDPAICLFCGEPERVGLFEMWSSHEFMIETCCEHLHETVVSEMAEDREWARSLLRRIGAEEVMGQPLRRLADDSGCGLVLDWQLRVRDVTFATARDFVARHHRHCRPPTAWRFGASIFNGRTMLGTVIVGNPVAPAFNGRGTLEVNRLCIRRDVPRALAWNAASMLYGWSAREAERRGWSHIITYTRADEEGTSVRAAGWQQEATVRGRGWHSSRRYRANPNAWIDKVRWGKPLRPRRPNFMEANGATATTRPRDCLADALFTNRQDSMESFSDV